MLLSMTGFGASSSRENGFLISSEVKTVNNRYLKTTIKTPDGFAALEPRIDELLHKSVERGSVNFSLKLERETNENAIELNFDALKRYLTEANRFVEENPEYAQFDRLGAFADFLRLPGVVCDKSNSSKGDLVEVLWPSIRRNVVDALERLQAMRRIEGATTAVYLKGNLGQLQELISEIERLAPLEVEVYRTRLTERVSKVLSDNGATLNPADLIREIAVYTDRADVSEEIARFYSHLKQFEETMSCGAACGKKLDFITQEMNREANTIGSKASSPEILQRVVEMKSTVERVREMIQNVE